MSNITLEDLCRINEDRQKVWPGASKITGDLGRLFVALEVAEEAGEVAGALKKLVRHDLGIAGNKGKTRAELSRNLEDEIADAFINLARLCNIVGCEPSEAVRRKFNDTSELIGVQVFL